MTIPILTHAAALILGGILVIILQHAVRRLRRTRNDQDFWRHQGVEALSNSGVLGTDEPLPSILLWEDRWAADTAIQVIAVARESGMLGLIERNPGATVRRIADFTGFSGRAVYAAVEVLLAAGLLQNAGNGYAITPATRFYVLGDSPLSAGFKANPDQRMLEAFRGGPTRPDVHKWTRGHAHESTRWAQMMHRKSFPVGFALHSSGLLDGCRDVLDVGGGAGSICIALGLKDPSKILTLIELPGSIPPASKMISRYGLSKRIRAIGMDMFTDEWPAGFDAVLFANVFHDWDDERCTLLARMAHRSLRKGGLLVLIEALLNSDAPGPLWTACHSVEMVMDMYGRQFRQTDLAPMLEAAGYIDMQVHPLPFYYSAVTAVRAD